MLNPSITPTRGSQPGYTTMMYDSETDLITNIEMTFLQLESAYMLPQTATKDDFQYLTVNYEQTYGLENLSAAQIAQLN